MIPSLRNHYHSRKPVSGIFFFYKYEQHRSILQPILPKYLETADTYRYAVSLLPDLPKYHSLPPEALVGWTPSNHLNDAFSASSQSSTGWVDRFREQRDFVEFMHAVIGKCVAVADLGVRTRARGVGNGWVHVCDERALCPLGRIPDPDDIIGSVHVRDGQIKVGSYQSMPSHRLLSHLGPFQLPSGIFDVVVNELYKRIDHHCLNSN